MKRRTTTILIISFLLSSCHRFDNKKQEGVSTYDSLLFNKYWLVLKDSLKYSNVDTNNNEITLDSSKGFSIVKGHFTSIHKEECLLKRVFKSRRFGTTFESACLFTFENSIWNCLRCLNKDSINCIDIDNDNIKEIYYSEYWVGNGSVDKEFHIISIKNNSLKEIFQSYNSDNRHNAGAFTISKVGDTVVSIPAYKFQKSKINNSLELVESKLIGIKKGVLRNRLLLDFSTMTTTYKLENGIYKNCW